MPLVQPPPDKRGALCTYGVFFVDNLVLIDWLSFTSQIHSPQDLISILGMDAASWTPGRGAYGYKDRLYYNCCSIHYNGGPDMGVWVELSGQGCRCFEDIGHGDYTMLFDLCVILFAPNPLIDTFLTICRAPHV